MCNAFGVSVTIISLATGSRNTIVTATIGHTLVNAGHHREYDCD